MLSYMYIHQITFSTFWAPIYFFLKDILEVFSIFVKLNITFHEGYIQNIFLTFSRFIFIIDPSLFLRLCHIKQNEWKKEEKGKVQMALKQGKCNYKQIITTGN